MYYHYDGGGGRRYYPDIEKAIESAVGMHLHLKLDVNRITIYELMTDRIVYQWCYKCTRATPWRFHEPVYSAAGLNDGSKTYLPGMPGHSACEGCGNLVSEEHPSIPMNGNPKLVLCYLFELYENRACNSVNLLKYVKRQGPRGDITVFQAIELYKSLLNERRRVEVVPEVQTPETIRIGQMRLATLIHAMSVDDTRTRMMDLNARRDS